MKNQFSLFPGATLAALALAASTVCAQTYDNQKALDDEIRAGAAELSFMDFDSELTAGKTTRCQIKYRVAAKENPYLANDAQLVQGSITSDYYEGKPINFILNLQPLRLDVNRSTRQASSTTLTPTRAALVINGQNMSKYQLEATTCDGSYCVIYAPTKAEEILDMMKAVQLKPDFDADIVYSLEKVLPEKAIQISSLTTHGKTNSAIRTQFTSCMSELIKKQVLDLQKLDSSKK